MKPSNLILMGLALVIVLGFVLTAMVFSQLPETVPTHWNYKGEADGFGRRATVWIVPVMQIPMAALFLGLSFGLGKSEREKTSFLLLGIMLSVFMLVLQCLILASCLNYKIDMSRWLGVAMCLMFMGLGFGMKDLPRNGLAGIRTPWSMASDEAWAITHQRAAWIIAIGSVIGLIMSLLGYGMVGIFVSVGSLLYTCVDSYFATRQIRCKSQ